MRRSLPLFIRTIVVLASTACPTALHSDELSELHLEVFVNGTSTGLIAAFTERQSGKLSITVEELRELRIDPAHALAGARGEIDLDKFPGLAYRYDRITQTIRIDLDNARRLPFVVDVRPPSEPISGSDAPATGAVVNYTMFVSSSGRYLNLLSGRDSAFLSAAFDARLFGPHGVLSQSAITTTATAPRLDSLRLDSTWTYSDQESLTTYRAGDVISGGLSWTRSLRLGGIQVQRNFVLRPDLITLPIPRFSGSAALPSTIDVFVNNARTYSAQVPAGPYQIQNLPVLTGASSQRIVVQDSLGRETVINQPFYTSARMLAQGLFDYSLEGGFVRRNYGVLSNDYQKAPAASGSFRYGVTDRLTLEGHAEAGGSLWNGGLGANVALLNWGVGSLAVAGSSNHDRSGALVSAAVEVGRAGYTFYVRSQRTTAGYADLASLPSADDGLALQWIARGPPRELDQAALGLPMPFGPSSLTLSFTRLRDRLDNRYSITGVSYNRPLASQASLFFTGFKDFANRGSHGVFAGLSFSLDGGVTATASASASRHDRNAGFDAVKAQPLKVGTAGWRLRTREGTLPVREAAVSYRSPFGRGEAGVQQIADTSRATGQFDGAVAIAGGSAFLSNRIDDAFAIVDVGAPDVEVFHENRPVARTNAAGVALVPYLRAYQRNRLSIDPANLPIDADVSRTSNTVAPADRSASIVRFGVTRQPRSAVVVLRDASGKPVAVGARARLAGASAEEAMVGYDGEIYLRGLVDENSLTVTTADGSTCKAHFPYTATPGQRVVIEDVRCR